MITHKKYKGKKSRLIGHDGREPIYLYEDEQKRATFQGDDVFPSVPKDYDFVLIAGPSGSGKTVWASKYIESYRKKYPKRNVYVVSSINEDKALDRLNVIRLDMDECFCDSEYEIDPESMKNSLVLFDDVDTLTSKKMRDNVLGFRDFLLEQGRHFNIHLVNTVHILLNYKATRRLLNESTKVVIFPKSGGSYQIKTFLQTYCGFMKEQITEFFNRDKNSRWKMVSKTYPLYVMSQHEVYSV